MTGPLLALDLGNSRLKACLFSAGGGAPSAVLEPDEDLVGWLRSLEAPAAVGLASVADAVSDFCADSSADAWADVGADRGAHIGANACADTRAS